MGDIAEEKPPPYRLDWRSMSLSLCISAHHEVSDSAAEKLSSVFTPVQEPCP